MKKKEFLKVSLGILLIFLAGWFVWDQLVLKPKIIDLNQIEPLEMTQPNPKEQPPLLEIAVGSMITPKEGYAYYKQLLNYISEKLNQPVQLVDKKTYQEINNLIHLGMIDMAFVCGQPYIEGKADFDMELLAAPQVNGKTVYHSYIIVPLESPAKSLKDLKGKTFAFADPMSNSGKLVPTYMLAKMGETPKAFFKKHVYSYAHDKTIHLVAANLVDGGAVDSLIWDYQNEAHPHYTSRTKIIEISPPCGIPPVVVRPDLDPQLKERLKRVLLQMDQDEKGKQILQGMKIDRFVEIKDQAYDFIREMKEFVSKPKIKK